MKRREFIAGVGGVAAAWPLTSRADQPERMRRISWLVGFAEQDPEAQSRTAVLVRALGDLGWIVGRNLHIDYRYMVGGNQRFDIQAAELVTLAPDVLIANSTPATRALQQASNTIPIVFAQVLDPVASGLVPNLARPGGNVTGFTNFEVSMGSKWLELLKEVEPRINKVALIFNRHSTLYAGLLRSIEASAASLEIDITTRGVGDATELEPAIAEAARAQVTALIVFPDIFTGANHQQIIALADRYKLPAIYAYRFFAAGGGLLSYGINTPDVFRRMAGYVDGILRGTKPSDLPVEAPNKFELVINLKTAKALGLEIPPKLLAYKTIAGKTPGEAITLAFCWAHLRRKFFDIAKGGDAPIASEALERIAALYAIEKTIRGMSADDRCRVRQDKSKPLVVSLKTWLEQQLARVSAKASIAEEIRYGLNHWDGLTRFLDDGRIELDTNIVERGIRPVVLNRKNALFAGHDEGAENWACIASLIETCKLTGVDPQAYFADVLTRLVNLWPAAPIDELMPWAWVSSDRIEAPQQAAA